MDGFLKPVALWPVMTFFFYDGKKKNDNIKRECSTESSLLGAQTGFATSHRHRILNKV